MKFKTVKIVDVNEIYSAMSKLLGIDFSNMGGRNVPTDKETFEIDFSDLDGHYGVLSGESCFVVKNYCLDKPCENDSFRDWDIPKDTNEFLKQCASLNEEKLHYGIPWYLCLEYMVIHNVLERGEEIWLSHDW